MQDVKTANEMWSPNNSFDQLKKELMKVDPVKWCENYLKIEGKKFQIIGNGWKFIADIYRHIIFEAPKPDAKPVVVVKGRQVGGTIMASALELYMMASGMYGGANTPSIRVMHAFPQLELMHSFSKDKLEKMINESVAEPDFNDKRHPGVLKPYIKAQKAGERESTDTLFYKQFRNGNTLWCDSIGAEGTRILGRTFDSCFFDEVQDMTELAISKTIKCMTRAKFGPKSKGVQVYFGTPRQKGTFFHRIWEESDQRRYYLGCEGCKNFFQIYTPGSDKWKEIWIEGNTVRCPSCGHCQDKNDAVERGKWIPSPGRENAKFVGFHINQFLIPEFTREVIDGQLPENNPLNSEIIWNNEVIGEFHSGEGMPLTFEEIYLNCRDDDRTIAPMIPAGEKITYLGVDWGGKPDLDGFSRGQSFSVGVVISVDHSERFVIEYATKLKKIDLESKKEFVANMFRLYGLRSAVGDIGYANDLSDELKKIYGDKFKTARNTSQVSGGIKYNEDELEIVVEKDAIIEEVFNLLRRGQIRFPWASYERIAWLVQQCCSMESRVKERSGLIINTYIKGKLQNDGLMALINAYLAYKFDKTRGFKMNSNRPAGHNFPKPVLGYVPKMR